MSSFLGKLNEDITPILKNISWLTAERFFRLSIGLVVNVWLARYLGPADFGLFNYALAWVAIFAILASFGMNRVLIRELSENTNAVDALLGTVWILRLVLGGAILLLSYCSTLIIAQHLDAVLVQMIGIITLATVFQAFDVVDQFFQSRVLSKYSVIARSLSFFCIAIIKIVLLLNEAPLISFAYAAAAEILLSGVGLLLMYKKRGYRLNKWYFDLPLAQRLIKESWPEMIAGFGALIFLRIDQIMLGHLASNEAMGLYAAALRLSEVWFFIPVIINSSLFPALLRVRQKNPVLYYQRLQQLLSLLMALSYLIAVSMILLASPLIDFLFGPAYAGAATRRGAHHASHGGQL